MNVMLSEKNVVITGASRGIGAEIATQFAQEGASLWLTETPENYDRLKQFGHHLAREYGVSVHDHRLDLRRLDWIGECVAWLHDTAEKVDVLINNAGINILSPALSITEQQWDDVVDINLKGTFFITREIAKLMIPQQSGAMIMIASQHGVVGNENRAPYCASKAGLIHLTKALALEWAKYGIRVNAISPTFVVTEQNRDMVENPAFQRSQLPKIPLRKMAVPQDIAAAALYLASDQAGMVTGHNLVIDGGWTAQ